MMVRALVIITLVLVLPSAAVTEPLAAISAENSAVASLRFDFDETSWDKVLTWLAEKNQLILQMDFAPAGRFTYHDPRPFAPEAALELVHGVLLDRGFTLIPRQGVLQVALLADELHWHLVPHVPASDLSATSPSRIVFTTFPLHGVQAESAAKEFEPILTPRGKIVPLPLANRIAVWDRAGVLVQLHNLLGEVDSATRLGGGVLRVFVLEHASVGAVAAVVRDMVATLEPRSAAQAPLVDFGAMGRQLGTSAMLDSFIPGFRLPGYVPDAPQPPRATCVAVDERQNALLVTGAPERLVMVAQVVKAMDVAGAAADPDPERITKTYPVARGTGVELARRLTEVFARAPDVTISGTDETLVVHAPAERHEAIARMVRELAGSGERLTAFPTGANDPKELAALLDRLFTAVEGKARPTIVADPEGGHILVRGSIEQVDEVRSVLMRLERPARSH